MTEEFVHIDNSFFY